ncbi:hypothetical protein ACVWXU_000667 [Streptomyces sp. TE33382]
MQNALPFPRARSLYSSGRHQPLASVPCASRSRTECSIQPGAGGRPPPRCRPMAFSTGWSRRRLHVVPSPVVPLAMLCRSRTSPDRCDHYSAESSGGWCMPVPERLSTADSVLLPHVPQVPHVPQGPRRQRVRPGWDRWRCWAAPDPSERLQSLKECAQRQVRRRLMPPCRSQSLMTRMSMEIDSSVGQSTKTRVRTLFCRGARFRMLIFAAPRNFGPPPGGISATDANAREFAPTGANGPPSRSRSTRLLMPPKGCRMA